MSTILSLQHISKSFGPKHVLRDVTLDVEPGKSLVIIGGSGTGKSVTLKCALGLMRPDSGQVLVDGVDLHAANAKDTAALKSRFGMLFQGGALFDSLRVWENIAFRLTHADKMPRAKAREAAIEALSKVGMGPEVGMLYPGELSGGMQKRVSLARAIVAQPQIMFFDEPTTGLDPIMADVIDKLIVEQVKRLGAAAVSITHDMVSARKIADEIAMLYNGEIIWRGPVSRIDDSGNAYVDQFVHGKADGPIQMAVRKG
jgi:phospholipid/cholesterol/gamma-HCH transport system ATP-binding protein